MIWIIVVVGILIDFLSKRWALAHLAKGQVIDLIPGYLDFSYLENRGAAFGIFQNNVWALSLISWIMALVIFLYLIKNKKDMPKVAQISFAMILAGAIGNGIDRSFYSFVVDFIHFHIENRWHFPTFNVADMFVTCGTFLLLIYLLFSKDDWNPVKE